MSKSRLVVFGGGGGASQVILGARPYFATRTAVLAVTDTGRSTGIARALGAIPAPGDIRGTLATLSNTPESVLTQVLQHRFRTSDVPQLDGMAFGNLLLAALTQVTGDFAQAIEIVANMVECTDHVLPVSTVNTHLCAELDDGSKVVTELNVRGLNKAPIRRLSLADPDAAAHPPVITAIEAADLVVIGPGSFFTSVLATLVFDGIVDALRRTSAPVVFVCNTTTQSGQTDGFRTIDHVKHLLQLTGSGVIDSVLINRSENISPELVQHYADDGIHLLQPDDAEIASIASLGVHPLVYNYIEGTEQRRQLWNKQDTIRHNPAILGQTLWKVVTDNGTDNTGYTGSSAKNNN